MTEDGSKSFEGMEKDDKLVEALTQENNSLKKKLMELNLLADASLSKESLPQEDAENECNSNTYTIKKHSECHALPKDHSLSSEVQKKK